MKPRVIPIVLASCLIFYGRADAVVAASGNFATPTQNYNSAGSAGTASENFISFVNVGDVIDQTASASYWVGAGHAYTLFDIGELSIIHPSAPGAPSGAALGVSSISWSWGAVPTASSYNIYAASDTSGLITSTADLLFLQTGLSTNTAYGIVAGASNVYGASQLSPATTVYTRAATPAATAVTQIWITSATLAWGLNENPPGTRAQVLRSSDNVSFAPVQTTQALSLTDTSIRECYTYYYKVRNLNGDGVYTGFDAPVTFTTMASTPTAPGGLIAEALSNNRLSLSWDFSPWSGVTQYKLYYDNNTGTIDYNTPLAIVTSTVAQWTTGALVTGGVYRFGLRAVNRCGIEETNGSVVTSAQAVASLTGVKAAIRVPQTGKRLKGNRVTIVAELISGSPWQTSQVRFQYRVLGGGAWTDITAAVANHPNPDLSDPYFVHWDADAAGANTYELRALATDSYSADDPAPPTITVIVDGTNYDTNETTVSGELQKQQKINSMITNTIQAADDATSQVTKVVIPYGSINDSTVTVTVINQPIFKPPAPQGTRDLGIFTKVELSNGQTQMASGKIITLSLNYGDNDGDGIIDGTSIEVARLRMHTASALAGPWYVLPSSVDVKKKTVSGTTSHFSFFALFAPLAANLDTVAVYPVPFRPNDGDTDTGVTYGSGNPNSGILFENLPAAATIKIYTVTGQLVADFSSSATSGKMQWDVKNKSGKDVATGAYLAVISSPGVKSVVKKVVILR